MKNQNSIQFTQFDKHTNLNNQQQRLNKLKILMKT